MERIRIRIINHRMHVELLDGKGRIVQRRPYERKILKEGYLKMFKRNKTILDGIERDVKILGNDDQTSEVSINSRTKITRKKDKKGNEIISSVIRKTDIKSVMIRNKLSVQYAFTATLSSGVEISARSHSIRHVTDNSLKIAREKAFNNLVLRLSNPSPDEHEGYDEDEGVKVLNTDVHRIDEGVIYYDTN